MSTRTASLALAIGLPIASALASLSSLSRFDASSSAVPPCPKTEEDQVESSLEEQFQDPNRPLEWKKALAIMVVVMVLSFGSHRLPGWGPDAVAIALVAGPAGFLSANTIHRVFGLTTEIIARQPDGTLAMKTLEPTSLRYHITSITILLLCTALLPIATFIPSLSLLCYTLLAILVPYPTSLLFNATKHKSQPIKKALFFLCATVGVTVALCVLIFGIAQLDLFKSWSGSAKKDQSEPKKRPISEQTLMGIMIFQPLAMGGLVIGTVVAALYRLDVALARMKSVNGNVQVEVGGEVDPRIPIQGVLTISEEEDGVGKMVPGFGAPIVVPTIAHLLRAHGEDGRSKRLVRPFYSALAMGALIMVLSSSTKVWSWGCEQDLVQQSGICDDNSNEFISLLAAVLICPFGIALVLAIAAWWRGESSMVWNYRADWGVPAGVEGQVSLIRDEKVSSDAAQDGGMGSVYSDKVEKERM